MNKTRFLKALSFMLCLVLVAAIALLTSACNDKSETPASTPDTVSESEAAPIVVGQGATEFSFTIVFTDGSQKLYTVKTDKKMVGEALVDAGLIAGSDGPYGLMVETVGGETVTYEKDKKYWAFLINDEYAMSGVDTTEIKKGESYTFKVSK